MTGKRFTRKQYAIYEKDNPICMTLRDVDIRLNELWEENEQLKSLNKYLIELLRETGATVEIEKVKMNDL